MYSIYKLLWIKENLPDVYARADKLLLVGEYVGYLLTGERVIDYVKEAAESLALSIGNIVKSPMKGLIEYHIEGTIN